MPKSPLLEVIEVLEVLIAKLCNRNLHAFDFQSDSRLD